MGELMPLGFLRRRGGGLGRTQTVELAAPFMYAPMVRLSFVGDEAQVSFSSAGEALDFCSVSLASGATSVRQMGRVVRVSGVTCGRPVVLMLRFLDSKRRQVKFVFGQ